MTRFEIRQSFLLFLTAFFWGTTFVAQSVAMDYMGPFTFIASRSLIGGCFLIPIIVFLTYKRAKTNIRQELNIGSTSLDTRVPNYEVRKIALWGGVFCGFLLFCVSTLQQYALFYTTVSKAGFLTSMYIVIVPLLGLFLGKKSYVRLWCGVVLAVIGLDLLSIKEEFSLNRGDGMMLICALVDAVHILFIDKFAVKTNPVSMACVQFFTCAFFATIASIIFEHNQITALFSALGPVFYAGFLSSGVAYTLQMVGQRGLNPAFAALIMSLESVIAAISGWILLDESFTMREFAGSSLMFLAVVIVQVPLKTVFGFFNKR